MSATKEYRFDEDGDDEADFYKESQGCDCLAGVIVVGLMFFVFGCLLGYYVGAL